MSTAAEFTTTDEQIERANATGLNPVVFIHGLWLLPSSGIAGPLSSRKPASRP